MPAFYVYKMKGLKHMHKHKHPHSHTHILFRVRGVLELYGWWVLLKWIENAGWNTGELKIIMFRCLAQTWKTISDSRKSQKYKNSAAMGASQGVDSNDLSCSSCYRTQESIKCGCQSEPGCDDGNNAVLMAGPEYGKTEWCTYMMYICCSH